MLIHLPIIILTSLHPTPIADAVPKFEIARECEFEGGLKEDLKTCVTDETQAREHGSRTEGTTRRFKAGDFKTELNGLGVLRTDIRTVPGRRRGDRIGERMSASGRLA